jgi:tetratricopeptide (TPR) repeat protein
VTNYNELYFSYQIKPFEIKGHTLPSKENKESVNTNFEKDFEQTISADKVLKTALAYFNKGKYEKALTEFQLLLEANPSDVNALFYSAVSYYHIGKYNHTIKNLEAVLKSPNNTFHPEAKWNLALSNLKIGEKGKAKQLLVEIVNEKGFYSKRAADKLKSL